MANQQLVDYIKSQLAAGVLKPEISKAVDAAGWTPADKDAAFAVVEGRPPAQASAPMPPPMPPKPAMPQQPVAAVPMRPVASSNDPGPGIRFGTVRGPVRWWFWAVILVLVIAIAGVALAMPGLRDTIFNSIFPLPAPVPVIDTTPEPTIHATTTPDTTATTTSVDINVIPPTASASPAQ